MKLWCGDISLLYTVQWQSINCKRKPNKTLVVFFFFFFQEERVFLHKPRLLTFIYLKWKGERGDLKEKHYLRAIENIPSPRKQGGSDEGTLIPRQHSPNVTQNHKWRSFIHRNPFHSNTNWLTQSSTQILNEHRQCARHQKLRFNKT